jgi:hypothetical protein
LALNPESFLESKDLLASEKGVVLKFARSIFVTGILVFKSSISMVFRTGYTLTSIGFSSSESPSDELDEIY